MAGALAFHRFKRTSDYKKLQRELKRDGLRHLITLENVVGSNVLSVQPPSNLRVVNISMPVIVTDKSLQYPGRRSTVKEAAEFLQAYGTFGQDCSISVLKSDWAKDLNRDALTNQAAIVQVAMVDLWAYDVSNVAQKLLALGARLNRCKDWCSVPHRLKVDLRHWLPFRFEEHFPLLDEGKQRIEEVLKKAVAPTFAFTFMGDFLKRQEEVERVKAMRASGWEVEDTILRGWPAAGYSERIVMLDTLITTRAVRKALRR